MRKNHHGKNDRLVKRVFALCLALAVICTCLVPVFATEASGSFQPEKEASQPVDDEGGEEEAAGFGGEEAPRPVDDEGGKEEAAGPDGDSPAVDDSEAAGSDGDSPAVDDSEAAGPDGDSPAVDDSEAAGSDGDSPAVDDSEAAGPDGEEAPRPVDGEGGEDNPGEGGEDNPGEDAVVDMNKEVVSGDEIKKQQDMVVYRFWLKELNALDLQDIAMQAQTDNMTESEYLAQKGEAWKLYFIQAVPRAETIADYSSYIKNPSSNQDPEGMLRLFDYWYTLDELGNRVRLDLTDPTSNILDDKTTTVNVYAAWKDGTVGSDEEEDVVHEDLVDKNPAPVTLETTAAATYKGEGDNTENVNPLVKVENLPSAADHLSVSRMSHDDMGSFYESHSSDFEGMQPLLGLEISPKNTKGEKVQLADDEKATVTVSGLDKLPEIAAMEEAGALNADALKVLHQKDDGTVEKLDVVSYENGTLTFETTSFSPFVIALTGGYDVETLAIGRYNETAAAIFILKNPNGNPNDTNESSWGYAVMGAKVSGPWIIDTHVLNLNDATYTLYPPTGWKTEDITYNDKTVKAWCLPSDVNGHDYLKYGGQTQNMWQQIFETYQNNITDVNGELIKDKTLTIDDIEKIYVIPYKLSQRAPAYSDNGITIPGLHIDCQIVVQCKSTYSVNFHITDVGETGSTRVSASTYFIQENANEVTIKENNGRVRESDGAYTNQYNNKIYEKEKTIKGVKYVFDGWYTDSSFDPDSKVEIPDSSSSVRSWSVTTQILSQNNNQLNYYGRYIPVSANLTVSKTVTGMLGDTNKAFTFQILNEENQPVTLTSDNCDFGDGSGTLLESGTTGKFTLKHGDTVTIKNLAPGQYTVTEVDDDLTGYETSWQVTANGVTGSTNVNQRVATVTMSSTNVALDFTNHRTLEPDTGVLLDTLPYIVILAVVAGGVALLMLRKHRKEDD